MRQLRSAPRDREIEKLKSMFDAMNAFISRNNGWVTSVRGNPEMRFDALPDSALPDELRRRGYVVTEIGEGERILPTAMTSNSPSVPMVSWSLRRQSRLVRSRRP